MADNELEATIASDRFIAQIQIVLNTLMEEKGISRSDLAATLQVSESRVSQMFKDEPQNFTAKTIARVFHAIGEEPEITCKGIDAVRNRHAVESLMSEIVDAKIHWRPLSDERNAKKNHWLRGRGLNDNKADDDFDVVIAEAS